MNAHDNFSRRALLTGGLASGFLLAFHLPLRAAINEPVQPEDKTDGKFAPNAFIRIDGEGVTTLVMPQVEMGQGIYTAVSMILAEELDADWSKVQLLHAPANEKLYAVHRPHGQEGRGEHEAVPAADLSPRHGRRTVRADEGPVLADHGPRQALGRVPDGFPAELTTSRRPQNKIPENNPMHSSRCVRNQ